MARYTNESERNLKVSGVAIVGTVDSSLIQNIQRHLDSQDVTRRVTRQAHLQWNDDCDAIEAYFESVSSMLNVYIASI
jgi:hypothetical protein